MSLTEVLKVFPFLHKSGSVHMLCTLEGVKHTLTLTDTHASL